MPINYHCDLDTEASTHEILTRVHTLVGGTVKEEPGGRLMIVTPGLIASVRKIDDPQASAWALEDWGVYSRITVSFELIRFVLDENTETARRALSIASVQLGEDLDRDATLLFELDRAMMRRKDGALTLYDWWPEWSLPEVVAALPSGFTLTQDRPPVGDG